MSPSFSSLSDFESETVKPRKGRPANAPDRLLSAADVVFARSDTPFSVTMDMIATEAGVGKATLFRAFGHRDGLLDALWAAKLGPLAKAVEHGPPPLGPHTDPSTRAIAFLEGLLRFKLANRHLIKAREIGPNFLQSERYRWMHGLLTESLHQAAPEAGSPRCGHAAHTLLAGLHIDVLDESLAGGMTVQELEQALRDHVLAMLTTLRRKTSPKARQPLERSRRPTVPKRRETADASE